jgi:erythromycin esterase
VRTTFVAAVVLVAAAVAAAQDDRVAWLKDNATVVRSIDMYGDDLSDLAPLKAAIGDARVVFLGEQTHGDGACFAAKSRLVKFLHRELGFDVLAWESGMEEMRRVDHAFAAGEPVEKAHALGLFGIWAISQQCRELLKYARDSHKTDHPLIMAGFDDQVTTDPATTPIAKDIVALFDAVDDQMLSPEQRQAPSAVLAWLGTQKGPEKPNQPAELESLRTLTRVIDRERSRLEAKHGRLEVAFIERAIGNLASYVERMAPGFDLTNHRDKRMAENLVWLANDCFKGKKIIVWAASMHNARRIEPIEWVEGGKRYIGTRPMGDYAWDVLGTDMYSIMFLAYQGRIGRPWTGAGPIEPAQDGSLDALLHHTGKPYLFIDFRRLPNNHWLREPIVARPLGYAPMKTIWPDHFDAAFFTDRMYPSTRIGAEPEDARPR